MAKEYSDKEAKTIETLVDGWREEFVNSKKYSTLKQQQKDRSQLIIITFADCMYSYYLEAPQDWDEFNAKEVYLNALPKKMIVESEWYDAVAPVLSAFFNFLHSAGHIKNGVELSKSVMLLDKRIKDAGRNSNNWGISKQIFMNAQKHGIDISTEKGVLQAIEFHNKHV
jgi:hypothetical protein